MRASSRRAELPFQVYAHASDDDGIGRQARRVSLAFISRLLTALLVRLPRAPFSHGIETAPISIALHALSQEVDYRCYHEADFRRRRATERLLLLRGGSRSLLRLLAKMTCDM